LSEAALRWLLHGEPTPEGPGFDDYVRARFMSDGRTWWKEHRDELLEEWTTERPGSRPAAWWEHDCPPRAERLKVGGTGEQGAQVYGNRVCGYFDCDPADPPCVESMATFLRRLALLLPGEEMRIPKRAWRPVTLDVDSEGWAPNMTGDEAA
jgi:hypothetical protein